MKYQAFIRRFSKTPESLLALTNNFICPLALGDITDDSHIGRLPAVLDYTSRQLSVNNCAIFPLQSGFVNWRNFLACQTRFHSAGKKRLAFRRYKINERHAYHFVRGIPKQIPKDLVYKLCDIILNDDDTVVRLVDHGRVPGL